jgi:hypothetical protein
VPTSRRSNKWEHFLLEDPVPGNVVETLHELGVEVIRVEQYEALAKCPAHLRLLGKEDRHPSWSVNIETGQHNCFSCGFRGPFYLIAKEMLGCSREDAVAWVKSKGSIDRVYANLTGQGVFVNELAVEITEADLALFTQVPEWACAERDLDPEAVDFYGVLWNPKRDYWITPIREWQTNRLIGWQEKGETRRHFRNHPKHMEKGLYLFGVNQHRGDTAILKESPLDLPKVYGALGEPLGLGSFGATVTDAQLDLMQDMGIKRIISALDNDRAGDKANGELIQRCRGRFRLDMWNYEETEAKDPGDQEDDEIVWSFENAYPAIEWVPSWR